MCMYACVYVCVCACVCVCVCVHACVRKHVRQRWKVRLRGGIYVRARVYLLESEQSHIIGVARSCVSLRVCARVLMRVHALPVRKHRRPSPGLGRQRGAATPPAASQ